MKDFKEGISSLSSEIESATEVELVCLALIKELGGIVEDKSKMISNYIVYYRENVGVWK